MDSKTLKEKKLLCEEIYELLKKTDKEFVPPLSARKSTQQKKLTTSVEPDGEPRAYFAELIEQNFILVLTNHGKKLAGFLSYRSGYEGLPKGCEKYSPAEYVSTIIVDPEFRGRQLSRKMYLRLIRHSRGKNIATRTWSQNGAHIHILRELGFEHFHTIPNDRGERIDTVYFGYKTSKIKWYEKLAAYRLVSKAIVCGILLIVGVVSQILCHVPLFANNDIVYNVLSAIFTSLYVSVAVLLSEILVSYIDNERDEFLLDAYSFGVTSLNKNKQISLEELLVSCKREVWISGYRLIMTDILRNDYYEVIKRGVSGSAVLCPPWGEAYKLVYGDETEVIFNYYRVFYEIWRGMCDAKVKPEFHIYVSEAPIFNDTYRVDDLLLSGPYMSTPDSTYKKTMAKDFFSYTLKPGSRLYELTNDEYLAIRDGCSHELDWNRFAKVYEDYAECEKQSPSDRTSYIPKLMEELKSAFTIRTSVS